MAGDALAELLAELPSAPRDPGAAERSRRSARAADKAVAELERPPFDAHELFLMMADGAGDVGALGGGLRRIGWTPDGLRPTPPAAPDPAPRKQPSRPRWRHSDSTILAAVPTVKTLAREVAEPLGYNRTETLVNRLERINARATAAGEVAPVVVSRSGNGNPVEVWRLLDVVAA